MRGRVWRRWHATLPPCRQGILRLGKLWPKQSREEKRRKQQRQVLKVLLGGLYDPDSPISKLLGVRMEVVGEIIWQKLVENWQIYPEHIHPPVHFPARKINCTVP